MRNLLLLLVFVFSAMDISAQAARGTRTNSQNEATSQPIVHVDQFIAALRGSGQTRSAANTPLRVESLINDVQSSSYVENETVKTYGDNPVCVFTDAASFANLVSLNFPKRDVELITVKLKSQRDLSGLDFSTLSVFPNLKYVYLISEVATTERDIVNVVRNNDPKVSVFYNLARTK
ncbi:hypothetical protein [Flavobacterium sp.]|uniref:hypothetical protein n=1 Tax=Flavobacterium sp. TaxID=239 RepID=UPI0025C0ECEC|nr:hypothetical protein [Flavobacterium sp.]